LGFFKNRKINIVNSIPTEKIICDISKFCQRRKIPINMTFETSSSHFSNITIGIVLEYVFCVFFFKKTDFIIEPIPPGEINIAKPDNERSMLFFTPKTMPNFLKMTSYRYPRIKRLSKTNGKLKLNNSQLIVCNVDTNPEISDDTIKIE